MSDCIFCKIVAGDILATIIKRSETAVAFRDLNPQAPVHLLIIPVTHVPSAREARTPEGARSIMEALTLAAEVAEELGLGESGYRLVTNIGVDGGQSVSHFHLHLLGGRRLGWPPG